MYMSYPSKSSMMAPGHTALVAAFDMLISRMGVCEDRLEALAAQERMTTMNHEQGIPACPARGVTLARQRTTGAHLQAACCTDARWMQVAIPLRP